ncbi:MAG: hypothetical protein RL213_1865 [Bacteroidota bacterium]|jgi:hypothetical protein
MRTLTFAALFFLIQNALMAQDTLFKLNREVLVVKISEVGLDEVKYKLWGYEDGPTVVVAKDQLQKIVYANGTVQLVQPEMTDPRNYAGQKKNAVKFDFFSLLRNDLSLGYERSLRPGRSIEANVGIVGVGINSNMDEASGAFFRIGYKFINTPDYYSRGTRFSHLLNGAYARPDLILGSYTTTRTTESYIQNPLPPYNYMYTYGTSREKISYAAFNISLGKQWIYSDAFLIDIFGGLGYVLSDSDTEGYGIEYGVLNGGGSSFSASGGFRIGLLIK